MSPKSPTCAHCGTPETSTELRLFTPSGEENDWQLMCQRCITTAANGNPAAWSAGVLVPAIQSIPAPTEGIGIGWAAVAADAWRAAVEACPSAELVAVKNAGGALHFVWRSDSAPQLERLEVARILQAAREQSRQTCESCGAAGAVPRPDLPWGSPTCVECAVHITRMLPAWLDETNV